MTTTKPADQAFSDRAGEAWAALQARTDAQLDPLGRAALAKLALVPGARVLDVGCGCGQTLLELADLVGPCGRVLGVDVSEPMLGAARARVAGRRDDAPRAQIDLTLDDAQTHPFEVGAFDAIYSRFGVMFFADARTAFANLRRAARPEARLAFVCWQPRAKNAWAEVPLRAVLDARGGAEPPALVRDDEPGPFYLSDPARVRAILAGAGFADVAIEPLEGPLHIGGAMTLEEGVDFCRQVGPGARALADAPEAERPALVAALARALAPFVRLDAGPRAASGWTAPRSSSRRARPDDAAPATGSAAPPAARRAARP